MRRDVDLIRKELDLSKQKEFWADNIARWRRSELESIEYKAACEARHNRGEFSEEEEEDDDDDESAYQDASFWKAMSDPCTWVVNDASPEEFWD
jgi:hypothetical protein